ncbi:MAG: hypothetical protein KDC27_12995, partial [Acidobacteria bacterium]|nr:hypothetical protein [Acidobacteriota bacterium]
MKVGTEDKKKTALAIGLSLVALATVYVNLFSGGSTKPSTPRPRPAAQPRAEAPLEPQGRSSRSVAAVTQTQTRSRRNRTNNFEPIWQQSHEGVFDPLASDPTLRTDLLAAVRRVPAAGFQRNIFQYGQRQRVVQPLSQAEIDKAIATANPKPAPAPPPPVAATPAAPARRTAPRITWKYYGFASPTGDG